MNQAWFLACALLTALALDAALIAYLRRRTKVKSERWTGEARLAEPKPSRVHVGAARSAALLSRVSLLRRRARRPMARVSQAATKMLEKLTPGVRAPATLGFIAGLAVYLATRLIGLEDFPIYFFTDEAVQTVLASDFLRDGFRDQYGTLLPTYFDNGSLFNLSLSVYLQVLPELLFQRSVFVTRATSVLVTASGAAALGLILRRGFGARVWWAGPLLLSAAPVWFLHSRTAFETVLMASLYAWFLYFYLLYRKRAPRYLYPALLFGGLTFYSYSPGQMIIVVTGILLLASDIRYHMRHRRQALGGALLLAALALPYLRFQAQHPGKTYYHLRMLNSYWLQEISITDKVLRFLSLYLGGHNPAYWFTAHQEEIIRHLMRGYPFLPTSFLALMIPGLVVAIRKFKLSENRALLASFLASPTGMALAGMGVTRMLAYVVPAVLLSALGLEAVASRMHRSLIRALAGVVLFFGLAGASLLMLRDALTRGPTWYEDYGLYGMQYGARQVFGEIAARLEEAEAPKIVLSPDWANGTDILLQFFLPEERRVELMGGEGLVRIYIEDLDQKLFVLTPEDYAIVRESPIYRQPQIHQTLPYPDGREGFFFVSLAYVDRAEEILAKQREQRRKPLTESARLEGQIVQIEHTPFGMGTLQDLFDGDPFTVVRTLESNPAVLDFRFPEPIVASGLALTVGTMDFQLSVELLEPDSSTWRAFDWKFADLPNDPTVEVTFVGAPYRISRMIVRILNPEADEYWMIHIQSFALR